MAKLDLVRKSPNVTDGARATGDLELEADVCIVGTGAGGAVAASVLQAAGLSVLMVEEGGYYNAADDFHMRESEALPKLYQEGMQRSTEDLAISILQGRAVGGTTVVNWTTSYRTPEDVVQHWADKHGVKGFKYAELGPHYDAIEERLCIHKVDVAAMNKNNRKLYDGCKALGFQVDTTRRNVYSCMQTGYCGTGCPVNAKRSMLVTLVPDAIEAGAKLVHRCRVDRLVKSGDTVTHAEATLLDEKGYAPTGKRARIKAKRFILAGGAINTPAVLLRSGINDNERVGLRTFLHPVVASLAIYDEPIEAFYGAPQSCASHEFAHRKDGTGFFMEVAPAYPVSGATATSGFGAAHRASFEQLSRTAIHIALAIDGFQDDVPGGRVKLRPSGAPVLDYPIPKAIWDTFKVAQGKLAEIGFASGAKAVSTLHDPPLLMKGKAGLDAIHKQRWEPCSVAVFTAHQMGGSAMGDDPKTSVVRSEDLRHHALKNLWIMDGSVFPTSLGVNPQESIYGLVRLMATRLVAAK